MYQPNKVFFLATLLISSATAFFSPRNIDCGPYGFICEGKSKIRLCEYDNLLGPTFICPVGTICNEESSDVCENIINYIDPAVKTIRCRRNERIADPTVPGCKGYILCIPNKNRFQGIKFKCTGNTIFNGFTRTCSSSERYKCPLSNVTKNDFGLFEGKQKPSQEDFGSDFNTQPSKGRPIDCKNYKLTVTQENSPSRVAYFCPPRPTTQGAPTKCTVFSNNFCIILERDDEDQFIRSSGAAYRRPRKGNDEV